MIGDHIKWKSMKPDHAFEIHRLFSVFAGLPPPLLPFSGASQSSSPSRQYQHIFLLLPFFPLMRLSRCEKSSHVIFHLVRYSIDFLSFQIFPSLLWLFDIGGSFLSCAVVCAFAIGTYHHHVQLHWSWYNLWYIHYPLHYAEVVMGRWK